MWDLSSQTRPSPFDLRTSALDPITTGSEVKQGAKCQPWLLGRDDKSNEEKEEKGSAKKGKQIPNAVVAKKPISNTRAQMHGLNGSTIQTIFNWCRGSFYFSLQKEADNVAIS